MIAALRNPNRVLIVCVVVIWMVQPFTLGDLLGDALRNRSPDVAMVASVMAWAWWGLTLVALAVARPVTLTLGRVGAVAAVPAAVWAAVRVDDAGRSVAGLITALAASSVVLLAGVGDRFVDGVSYGNERRFLLRPPGPVMLIVLPLTWASTVAALWAPPLLLAAHRPVLGVGASVAGAAVAFVGFRAMHQLSRRLVMFVPNGMVLHDPTVVREPVRFVKREIIGLAPAVADSGAKDLTAAALGLALELKLAKPVVLPIVSGRSETTEQTVRSVLVSVSRPAGVMATALERGIAIA